jgi:hypothetical protein
LLHVAVLLAFLYAFFLISFSIKLYRTATCHPDWSKYYIESIGLPPSNKLLDMTTKQGAIFIIWVVRAPRYERQNFFSVSTALQVDVVLFDRVSNFQIYQKRAHFSLRRSSCAYPCTFLKSPEHVSKFKKPPSWILFYLSPYLGAT